MSARIVNAEAGRVLAGVPEELRTFAVRLRLSRSGSARPFALAETSITNFSSCFALKVKWSRPWCSGGASGTAHGPVRRCVAIVLFGSVGFSSDSDHREKTAVVHWESPYLPLTRTAGQPTETDGRSNQIKPNAGRTSRIVGSRICRHLFHVAVHLHIVLLAHRQVRPETVDLRECRASRPGG